MRHEGAQERRCWRAETLGNVRERQGRWALAAAMRRRRRRGSGAARRHLLLAEHSLCGADGCNQVTALRKQPARRCTPAGWAHASPACGDVRCRPLSALCSSAASVHWPPTGPLICCHLLPHIRPHCGALGRLLLRQVRARQRAERAASAATARSLGEPAGSPTHSRLACSFLQAICGLPDAAQAEWARVRRAVAAAQQSGTT